GCAWSADSPTTRPRACPRRASPRARAGRTSLTPGPAPTAGSPRTISRWSPCRSGACAAIPLVRPGGPVAELHQLLVQGCGVRWVRVQLQVARQVGARAVPVPELVITESAVAQRLRVVRGDLQDAVRREHRALPVL